MIRVINSTGTMSVVVSTIVELNELNVTFKNGTLSEAEAERLLKDKKSFKIVANEVTINGAKAYRGSADEPKPISFTPPFSNDLVRPVCTWVIKDDEVDLEGFSTLVVEGQHHAACLIDGELVPFVGESEDAIFEEIIHFVEQEAQAVMNSRGIQIVEEEIEQMEDTEDGIILMTEWYLQVRDNVETIKLVQPMIYVVLDDKATKFVMKFQHKNKLFLVQGTSEEEVEVKLYDKICQLLDDTESFGVKVMNKKIFICPNVYPLKHGMEAKVVFEGKTFLREGKDYDHAMERIVDVVSKHTRKLKPGASNFDVVVCDTLPKDKLKKLKFYAINTPDDVVVMVTPHDMLRFKRGERLPIIKEAILEFMEKAAKENPNQWKSIKTTQAVVELVNHRDVDKVPQSLVPKHLKKTATVAKSETAAVITKAESINIPSNKIGALNALKLYAGEAIQTDMYDLEQWIAERKDAATYVIERLEAGTFDEIVTLSPSERSATLTTLIKKSLAEQLQPLHDYLEGYESFKSVSKALVFNAIGSYLKSQYSEMRKALSVGKAYDLSSVTIGAVGVERLIRYADCDASVMKLLHSKDKGCYAKDLTNEERVLINNLFVEVKDGSPFFNPNKQEASTPLLNNEQSRIMVLNHLGLTHNLYESHGKVCINGFSKEMANAVEVRIELANAQTDSAIASIIEELEQRIPTYLKISIFKELGI